MWQQVNREYKMLILVSLPNNRCGIVEFVINLSSIPVALEVFALG